MGPPAARIAVAPKNQKLSQIKLSACKKLSEMGLLKASLSLL
jgi:hypothetical protein